jgi:hypothetical protein
MYDDKLTMHNFYKIWTDNSAIHLDITEHFNYK